MISSDITEFELHYPRPLQHSLPHTLKMPPTPIPLFATTQLHLLSLEHSAEVSTSKLASTAATVSPSTRRTLQSTGQALTGLLLSQCRTGLGGRLVGEFVPDPAITSDESRGADGTPRFSAHGLRVGDVVRVNDVSVKKSGSSKEKDKDEGEKGGPEGVVTRTSDKAIWIAFGKSGKEDDEGVEGLWGRKLWAIKLANDVTYRRYGCLILEVYMC